METDLIAWLRRRVPPHPNVLVGIGDDAAVLRLPADGDCLVTVDMLTDQVDFRLEEADPRRIGRKALAVNLSDIAAMAGVPVAAFVALVLPRRGGGRLAEELYAGMQPLADAYGVALAGGDTNSWDGPLAISVTLVGSATDRGPLVRSGARPGDKIVVTGSFGGSILGRHFDFEPRVREAIELHRRYELHAGIDVSDGLSLDLARMAAESGCGVRLELERVPIASAANELATQRAGGG
ncbi:MAG TPA: thiamine-phosphate kinase, partial [Pirellulales bacterium]|nr:thiamine-phosphate kinase [Pirellulales bacterium]